MSKQVAIKLRVQVGPDHTLKLPAEVPEGPAEVIVLIDESSREAPAKGLLGLFADEPEVVDEATGYIRAHRHNWRVRPGT